MSDQKLVHQKKCPNCGQWSGWKMSVEDRCQHCQSLLDADSLKRREKKEQEQRNEAKKFNLVMIEINPADSAFTRFYKRIIQGLQLTFIAILSFIIWLVTIFAG